VNCSPYVNESAIPPISNAILASYTRNRILRHYATSFEESRKQPRHSACLSVPAKVLVTPIRPDHFDPVYLKKVFYLCLEDLKGS